MSPSLKLDSNPNGKKVDMAPYGGIIGNMLYLTTSKLAIVLSVYLWTRYQANPKELHLLVVRHIMIYLVGTSHLSLWYPKSNMCSLLGYLDADFVGRRTNRKSTIGRC